MANISGVNSTQGSSQIYSSSSGSKAKRTNSQPIVSKANKNQKSTSQNTSFQEVTKDSYGRDFLNFKDSNGTKLFNIELNNPNCTYKYNDKGQLISVQANYNIPSLSDELTVINYDDNGNIISLTTTNKDNQVIESKEFKYDSNKRVIQAKTEHPITRQYESIANYEYNKDDQFVERKTDLNGNLYVETKYESTDKPTAQTFFEQIDGKDVPTNCIVYEYNQDGSYKEYQNNFQLGILEQVTEYDKNGRRLNVSHPNTPIDVDQTIKDTFTKLEQVQMQNKKMAEDIVNWMRKGVEVTQEDIRKATDNNFKLSNDLELRYELFRLAAIRMGVIKDE